MPAKYRNKQFAVGTYHIFQVGKGVIFTGDIDFQRYLSNLRRFVPETDTKILAYCLMPNGLDLLVRQSTPRAITTLMRKLTTAYSMYKKGSPFRGVYKARLLAGDRDALDVSRQIHRSPMTTTNFGPLQIRSTFSSYLYSSYHLYLESTSNNWIDTLYVSRLVPSYNSYCLVDRTII
jgi:REP element-mobilizing transposase RayT